jgi:hypothetical protein
MTKHFILKKIEEYMDLTLSNGVEFKEMEKLDLRVAEGLFTLVMTDFKTFIEYDDECNLGRSYNAQLN